jgi:hypothetical protein
LEDDDLDDELEDAQLDEDVLKTLVRAHRPR